jgi:hypothetical protein
VPFWGKYGGYSWASTAERPGERLHHPIFRIGFGCQGKCLKNHQKKLNFRQPLVEGMSAFKEMQVGGKFFGKAADIFPGERSRPAARVRWK